MIAQDLFALGRASDAAWTLARLARYPKITAEERALGSRAKLIRAAIRFEAGDLDQGLQIAQSIADDDPEAPQARLLVTTALLDTGKPGLALVYDTADAAPTARVEGMRALTLSRAYASLGDEESAARALRGAVQHVHAARLDGPALEHGVDRLKALAAALVDERREREAIACRHVAGATRIVLANDGPRNLGTIFRHARAALGAGAYRELALGTKPYVGRIASDGSSWPEYFESPERRTIELVLGRLADLETNSRPSDGEAALRILDAYLPLARAGADRPGDA